MFCDPGAQDEDQLPLPGLSGRQLVVFSSAGATYSKQSRLQDFLNPYLGQVFGLLGFDKQEFVFIQVPYLYCYSLFPDWTGGADLTRSQWIMCDAGAGGARGEQPGRAGALDGGGGGQAGCQY